MVASLAGTENRCVEELRYLLRTKGRPTQTSWILQRRDCRARLEEARARYSADLLSARELLATSVIAACESVSGLALDRVGVSDYAADAVHWLRAKQRGEDAAIAPNIGGGMPEIGDAEHAQALSQLGPADESAAVYLRPFLAAAGRVPADGPPPASCVQPRISARMENDWGFRHWADYWLWLGGYGGAEQTDASGAAALHYAIQATVYFSHAWKAARGLMACMSPAALDRPLAAGRLRGFTALHLLASGSDRELRRASLVQHMLAKRANVDVRDHQNRTPLLLAVGTSVTDVAQELIKGGADIRAVCQDGKGVLDRCGGSKSLRGCRLPPAPC